MGAVNANIALRQVLVSQNMLTLAKPEVYVGNMRTLFADGQVAEATQKFIASFGRSFTAWIERVAVKERAPVSV
jgi:hypothetical protein